MVKSVVREHHWSPEIIKELFHDNIDYLGLVYWYNDVCEVIDDVKNKKPKT